MHLRKLFAAVAMSVAIAFGAEAQTAPDAGTGAQPAPAKKAAPTKKVAPTKKALKKPAKKTTTKKKRKKKGTPVDDQTRKALESKTPPAPTVIAVPAPEAAVCPEDNSPPVLSHKPVTAATKGKALTITAYAADPCGIFGPVLYLRKKGLPSSDYIPMRMTPSKTGAPGEYAVEIPAALVGVDTLEYYIEVWDNAGNGPARAGSAESPLPIKVEEEKKIILKEAEPIPPPNVAIRPKGAPPEITHNAVTQATRGQSIEIHARMVGDTGVQGATVWFRHAGERDFRALPMGNIGGDEYTATVPASMTSSDIEYYLEAFDRFGNGPARSGGPTNPYRLGVSSQVVSIVPSSKTEAAKTEAAPDRNTLIGIALDAGAPGGAGFTLLVRPLWWLRLNGGLAYNYAGFGYRGGLSLAPCWCSVTPTLNVDAGHYVSGDLNKYVTVTDPAAKSLLADASYTFATAQIGLEFGSQRWFSFYMRGGLTYVEHTLSGKDLTALAQGKISNDPSTTYAVGNGKFSGVLPCFSLGFNIFVY
jgi:hypothetical protein